MCESYNAKNNLRQYWGDHVCGSLLGINVIDLNIFHTAYMKNLFWRQKLDLGHIDLIHLYLGGNTRNASIFIVTVLKPYSTKMGGNFFVFHYDDGKNDGNVTCVCCKNDNHEMIIVYKEKLWTSRDLLNLQLWIRCVFDDIKYDGFTNYCTLNSIIIAENIKYLLLTLSWYLGLSRYHFLA